jgi:hypothetical protein
MNTTTDLTSSMRTITIPSQHKIGACCSHDTCRWTGINHVCLESRPAGSYLVATNTRVLALVPVNETVVVPPGQVNDFRTPPMFLPAKACQANGSDTRLTISGQEILREDAKKRELFNLPDQDGRFPSIKDVLPSATAPCDLGYVPILLDAQLLATLAAALSPQAHVVLFVPSVGAADCVQKPIIVVGRNSDTDDCTGIGLAMPMNAGSTESIGKARVYYRNHVEHFCS